MSETDYLSDSHWGPIGTRMKKVQAAESQQRGEVVPELPQAAIGCIHFRDASGEMREWNVGVLQGVDNEQTLREHLAKYVPNAEFVWCEFK